MMIDNRYIYQGHIETKQRQRQDFLRMKTLQENTVELQGDQSELPNIQNAECDQQHHVNGENSQQLGIKIKQARSKLYHQQERRTPLADISCIFAKNQVAMDDHLQCDRL